jgi:hypothetical protein
MVYSFGVKARSTKDNGRMTNRMAKVFTSIPKVFQRGGFGLMASFVNAPTVTFQYQSCIDGFYGIFVLV